MNNKEQMEWAKEFPFLAAMPKKNTFIVPEGYFETAADNSKSIAAISNHANTASAGFSVPEGYFTGLTANIMAGVNLEGLKEESTGFSLPEGYFNKLSAEIMAKTVSPAKKEVKVFKLWTSDMMKYSAAACVILIASAGLYLNQQNKQFVDTTRVAELYNEQILYDIDESVIVEQIQQEHATDKAANSKNNVEEYLLENYSTTELAQEL